MTYQKLINSFLANEKKLKLNKFIAISYLQIRFYLFRRYQSEQLGSSNKTARVLKVDLSFIVLELFAFVMFFIKLPFFIFYSKIVFFCEHARYINIDDYEYEPYSFLSQRKVMKNDLPIVRLGTIKNGTNDIKYNNFKYLFISQYQFQFISILVSLLFIPINLVVYIILYSKLNKFYNKKVINKNLFIKLNIYFGRNILSLILFLFIRPNKVNVTESYNSNSSFVLMANILNIESYEYQHGMISKSHIAYNITLINQDSKKIYLPRFIYAWSLGWNNFIPIVNDKLVSLIDWTYEYFYYFNANKLDNIKKSIDILIIGQPSVQKELYEIAKSLIIKYPNKRIVYKYHPKEIRENLLSLDIELAGDDLYLLLLSSTLVVGGFSTALLEAKALGNDVVSISRFVPDEYLEVLKSFSIELSSNIEDIDINTNNLELKSNFPIFPINLNNKDLYL